MLRGDRRAGRGGKLPGALPSGGLIDFRGTLYGTSSSGGNCSSNHNECGTIFAVSLRRNVPGYGVYYTFPAFPYSNPAGNLISVNSKLYGTTFGSIYSFDPKSRVVSTIYSFGQSSDDAWGASAGLIDVAGILYGTTAYGGASGDGPVFSYNLASGVETVLYSFQGGSDGYRPTAGLIDVGGTLYGTTEAGGSGTCRNERPPTCGTIFSLDPASGAETVVHAFRGGKDGEVPQAGLIQVGGRVYGTTSRGGANRSEGTVFSLNPTTGTVAIVHVFGGAGDGSNPAAGLIDVAGMLYGTTYNGGALGYGTIFALKP